MNEQIHKKPPSPILQAYLAKHCRPAPIKQIAHEIINQLTAISLVGSRILAQLPKSADAKPTCEADSFERAINEATALVRQLADQWRPESEQTHRDTVNTTSRPRSQSSLNEATSPIVNMIDT
jgi:hypothetical protein